MLRQLIGAGLEAGDALREAGIDPAEGLASLAALELLGHIRRGPGGRYTVVMGWRMTAGPAAALSSRAMPIPRVLSIAGSDSGGGAGIQADLKAFAACGAHGMTAITALTAQNTVGVSAVHAVPPEVIVAQVRAVVEDIGVDAIKIGMLGTVETIDAVARALELVPAGVPVVIDPVMVAESGAVLLEPGARGALVERLFARAAVVTPNVPEARVLTGLADADARCRAACAGGARARAASRGGHRRAP